MYSWFWFLRGFKIPHSSQYLPGSPQTMYTPVWSNLRISFWCIAKFLLSFEKSFVFTFVVKDSASSSFFVSVEYLISSKALMQCTSSSHVFLRNNSEICYCLSREYVPGIISGSLVFEIIPSVPAPTFPSESCPVAITVDADKTSPSIRTIISFVKNFLMVHQPHSYHVISTGFFIDNVNSYNLWYYLNVGEPGN